MNSGDRHGKVLRVNAQDCYRLTHWACLVILLILFNLILHTPSHATPSEQHRLALVIGNAHYDDATALPNAINDARVFAVLLQSVGYQVILIEDGTRDTMITAIQDFSRRLLSGGVGVFYFSGHAVEGRRGHTLIPKDWINSADSSRDLKGIGLSDVLQRLSQPRPNKTNLVILDTCREDPFPVSHDERPIMPAKTYSSATTLIAHATSRGARASDGNSGHGLFTGALLHALSVPGISLLDALSLARTQVMRKSRGAQVPEVSGSLERALHLEPPARVREAFARIDQDDEQQGFTVYRGITRQLTDAERDRAFWQTIQDSQNPADYQTYLRLFPDGAFASEAKSRVTRLLAPAPSKPAPQSVDVEELSEERIIRKDANVRAGPSTAQMRIAALTAGTKILVTGRTKSNWFRVKTPTGLSGFVYGSLLQSTADMLPEHVPQAPLAKPEHQAQPSTSTPEEVAAPLPQPARPPLRQPLNREEGETELAWEILATSVPEGFQTRNLKLFAGDVEHATKGALQIQVHTDPQKYSSREIKRAVANGQVLGGAVILSELGQESEVYEVDALPFVASDYHQAQDLWNASKPVLEPLLAAEGVRVLFVVAPPPQGFFVRESDGKIKDMQGLRVLANTAIDKRMAVDAGASAVQLPMMTIAQAFATNEIDAVFAGLHAGIEQKLWQYVHYYYDLRISLPKTAVIMNNQAVEALREEHQVAILNAAIVARNRGWRMSAEEYNKGITELPTKGVTVTQPMEPFQDRIEHIGETISQDWIGAADSEAKGILNDFRSTRANMR
ncbi:MAG: TRAP transporter substrate-binding protein DctP [Hyphomicrobiales bacterium]|nr:TRAP transporter substrate-binding protein DctP [Hyphomicrobiales bacterium]